MARERIAHIATERCLHPREALDRRFPLDEDAAEISLVRETLDRRLVDRLLFGLQKSKNLRGERGRHPLENFVRSHSSGGDDDSFFGFVHSVAHAGDIVGASAPLATPPERQAMRLPYNFATESASGASASIFPAKRFVM